MLYLCPLIGVSVVPAGIAFVAAGGCAGRFSLRIKDLRYWDSASSSWKVEPGMVKVIVAPNAAAAACTGGSGPSCALSDTFMVN